MPIQSADTVCWTDTNTDTDNNEGYLIIPTGLVIIS